LLREKNYRNIQREYDTYANVSYDLLQNEVDVHYIIAYDGENGIDENSDFVDTFVNAFL
jgi:hypothetical protein